MEEFSKKYHRHFFPPRPHRTFSLMFPKDKKGHATTKHL